MLFNSGYLDCKRRENDDFLILRDKDGVAEGIVDAISVLLAHGDVKTEPGEIIDGEQ